MSEQKGVDHTSSCLCGAVNCRVQAEKPLFNVFCHCKACSRANNHSPVHLLGVPEANFSFTKGKEHVVETRGYGRMRHTFCKKCGSSLSQWPEGLPFRVVFPVNFHIENGKSCQLPKKLEPTFHINYENRIRDINDDLIKYEVFQGSRILDNKGNPVIPRVPSRILHRNGAPDTRMPMVGLGTWRAAPGDVGSAVTAALKAGYRHIDAAACYGNETEVGAALSAAFKSGLVRREDIFVTSKLWNSEHGPENVAPALRQTLQDLGLDYLDLYLIHWPQAFQHVSDSNHGFPRDKDGNMLYDTESTHEMTWKALEACVDAGLVRHLGLSNFTKAQIEHVCTIARIKPVVLQVEVHPFFQQHGLVDYCKEAGIVVTGYSPLGSGSTVSGYTVPTHPTLMEIGEKYGKSAAQVALRMQTQRGIVMIPKSVTPSRISQNIDLNFTLSEEDMATLATLDKNIRTGWGGPTVERNGQMRPRDEIHPWYPFKMLAKCENDPETF